MMNFLHGSKSRRVSALRLNLVAWAGMLVVVVALWGGCKPADSSQETNSPNAPANPEKAAQVEALSPAELLAALETSFQERAAQQKEQASQSSLFTGFTFTDQHRASSINFMHRVVEDAGKHYKAVHYDHGSGVAVGDVNRDGLLDLYFTSQIGGNHLYINRGKGRFQNMTEAAGVGLADRVSVAAAFADVDNDGDTDLYVTTVKMGNVLFLNQGRGRFIDASKEAGLDYTGHSSGMVFFDYDRDGWLDLFLCNVGTYTTDDRGVGGYFVGLSDAFQSHMKPERAEASILYRNLGDGKFKDVSAEMNLVDTGWSGDASLCDLNGDGWMDLYVLNMQGDDHCYINMEGKRFEERTADYFPKTPWGCMGINFLDFNRDGLQDLILTDMHSDMTDGQIKTSRASGEQGFEKSKSEAWCAIEYTEDYLQGASNNIFGNAFYINRGQGNYEEVSDAIGAETFWPWGVTVGDLNADGYEDVFVSAGMGYMFRYGLNSVLLNDAGKSFVDAEFVVGVEPRRDNRTTKVAFVLDCSGVDQDHPLCKGRTGKTSILEDLSTRSAVVFDLDNDGDLDIVTNEMNDRPQVLISDLSERKEIHYLKVQLVGTQSNRDGLGAVVTVRANGLSHTMVQDGKAGYFAFGALPLYFGLGDASEVESVQVTWPNGQKQEVLEGIPQNGLLTVTETR